MVLNAHQAKLVAMWSFAIHQKSWIRLRRFFELLRNGQRDKVNMWFQSERLGKFVYVTYAAVRDQAGDFQGVLEYVQDIKPFLN